VSNLHDIATVLELDSALLAALGTQHGTSLGELGNPDGIIFADNGLAIDWGSDILS
jgi:hypothetical protein